MNHTIPTSITRGDIRVVTNPTTNTQSLCLVIKTNPVTTDILLAHTTTEFATSTDAIIPTTESKAPYPLVIQTDLRGTIWTHQLNKRTGHITAATFATLNTITTNTRTNPTTIPHPQTGIPLLHHNDQRWHHKISEGNTLRALTHHCTTYHLTEHPDQHTT